MFQITDELINSFESHLNNEEKAPATISKYIHDVRIFTKWSSNKKIEKTTVLAYKTHLITKYSPASVNTIIASLNQFFLFCEWHELRLKSLKIQRQIYATQDTELTKAEYQCLLTTAEAQRNDRLYLLMQTICSTGIRISELCYITVEAVNWGRAEIRCKGKIALSFYRLLYASS